MFSIEPVSCVEDVVTGTDQIGTETETRVGETGSHAGLDWL